jgi:putative glutamine amidotransferase
MTEADPSSVPRSHTRSRRRRLVLILLVGLAALPVLLVVAYAVWRPSPPEGGPRIGLSMASSFVVQRPLYEDALARAGGRPVLITPTDDDARFEAMLDGIDGLLLTGGDDVDPARYDGNPQPATGPDSGRDAFEIRLIRGALDRNLPILGICRGIQILNVAHGGSIRDLRAEKALSNHHGIGVDSFSAHDVTIIPGTHLADAVGAGVRRVNSFHGQAVDRVGSGLRVSATADDDVVEGIERPDRPFVIGIQWHPEITSLTDSSALALYEALVRQADAHRTARRVRTVSAGPAARE